MYADTAAYSPGLERWSQLVSISIIIFCIVSSATSYPSQSHFIYIRLYKEREQSNVHM